MGFKEGIGACYFPSSEQSGSPVCLESSDLNPLKKDQKTTFMTCVCEFHQGQMHGCGTLKWSDGSEYQGEFFNGKKEGYGIFRHIDGTVFKGQWKNDQLNGLVIASIDGR